MLGVLNSAIFNSFHNRVEFGTIVEGLRNFGRGGLKLPKPLPLVRLYRVSSVLDEMVPAEICLSVLRFSSVAIVI